MMKSSFLRQCEVRITEVTDHTFRKTLKSAYNSSRQLMSSNDQTRGRTRNVTSDNLCGHTRSNQNYQFSSLSPIFILQAFTLSWGHSLVIPGTLELSATSRQVHRLLTLIFILTVFLTFKIHLKG